MNRTVLKIAIGLFLFASLLIAGAHFFMGGPIGDGKNSLDLIVESGDSPTSIARELGDQHIIKSKKYFLFLVKISGNSGKFKQGVFPIHDGMSAWDVMQTIVGGKVKLVTFTIPEGYNNRQIGDLLVEKKLVKTRADFLEATEKSYLLQKYKIPAKSLEGYLFPETYSVPLKYPAEKIAEMMVKMFFKKLKKVKNYNESISPRELHDLVILASIVEREAKKKEEQALMAGVFMQREKIDMNLESCATIQYLFDKPKSRLFEKDLKIVSPYNTYLNKGFPPGPISNPGLPAIIASFNPVTTDKLFFVLKPDGSHYFSKSLKEHLDAKKKYIDNLR